MEQWAGGHDGNRRIIWKSLARIKGGPAFTDKQHALAKSRPQIPLGRPALKSWPSAEKWRGWLHRIKLRRKYFAASFALAFALLTGFVLYSVATLPITGGLQVEATQSALTFEGAQGEVFAARGVFKGDKLTAADLPPHLAQAIVAIEDRRFYEHIGVDFRGILRAGWRNSQAGGTREGGSTITQQLARLCSCLRSAQSAERFRRRSSRCGWKVNSRKKTSSCDI